MNLRGAMRRNGILLGMLTTSSRHLTTATFRCVQNREIGFCHRSKAFFRIAGSDYVLLILCRAYRATAEVSLSLLNVYVRMQSGRNDLSEANHQKIIG